MIIENKPNQHYVWQKYLEPWKKGNKIAWLRNKKDIIESNSRNVASERYFYDINGVTLNDCTLIKQIFISKQIGPIKSLLEDWIKPIETFLLLYNVVPNEREIKSLIEIQLKNLLEELHTQIESDGMSGLCKIQSGDVTFLSKDDDLYEEDDIGFIIYLCFQYFRTKKNKSNVKEGLGEYTRLFNDFDNAFNLIALILSTRLGYTLLNHIKNKVFHCYLLENDSEIPFITGDQPVINTHASSNVYEEVNELELYYPITPGMSLLITKDQIENKKCCVKKVQEYNKLIVRQSHEIIFANDAIFLHPYII